MAEPAHTYGPTCALYDSDSKAFFTKPNDSPHPPRVRTQFFYVSALPIDDPLSPIPPPSEAKASQSKAPPQPFSVKDNNALEEAWQGIQSGGRSRPSSSSNVPTNAQQPSGMRLGEMFRDNKEHTRFSIGSYAHGNDSSTDDDDNNTDVMDSLKEASRKAIPSKDFREQRGSAKKGSGVQQKINRKSSKAEALRTLRNEAVAATEQSREEAADGSGRLSKDRLRKQAETSQDQAQSSRKAQTDTLPMGSQKSNRQDGPNESSVAGPNEDQPPPAGQSNQRPGSKQSFLPRPKSPRRPSPSPSRRSGDKTGTSTSTPISRHLETIQGDSAADFSDIDESYTSGRPFARAPSRKNVLEGAFDGVIEEHRAEDEMRDDGLLRSRSHRPTSSATSKQKQRNENQIVVPVGIARLHLVELPQMMMKPIYWSPVNDVARVLRATWFYKNTMSPVEPDVANRLELGYEDMKPWTNTWQDELNSCMEFGPEAELKVTRRLWPEDDNVKPSRPGSSGEMKPTNDDGSAQDKPSELPENTLNIADAPGYKAQPSRLFPNHSVIYVDGKDAQLLRPSLAPSIAKRRTPLASIRKGRQIGVAVVRGFDRKTWDSLHPPKKMDARTASAKIGAYVSQSGDAATRGRRLSCVACQMQEEKPAVTDLVLVIHGIGQKLSERMESYHFTHAINSLRRQVNVELVNEAVQGNLRKNMGGIMVLPINWRLTVQLESEGEATPALGKKRSPVDNEFSLKDITPETLPAVRSLISDVMLDIPYYMSVHKSKMVSAVVKEANRVYRLWCRNNPGFHQNGRVHLIAHSLGSAMSMDILSQQPTKVPRTLDLNTKPNEKSFEFDTRSLFCCGSPAGFFILLNNSNLLPRKGRNKPGAEGEDRARGVGGDLGTYGCLAVDNIYNIMHYNDPIAYHMNACVDADYAHSIKPGIVPSFRSDWFSSLASVFKWSSDTPSVVATTQSGRPNMTKLPSTIEMNTHDFTHEEIAEKRMYLLNDNGQVDFFLSSGGGPLEIQYLSMLSAHSSYWTLQDFVRFIVMEVGRTPGRAGTLPVLRAEKKRIIKRGTIA